MKTTKLNTNKTQILHPIRLKKFVPNQPLKDNFPEQRLQPDEKIVIPQDELYIITLETDFCEQLVTRGNEPIPTSLTNGEQPNTAENTNDATEAIPNEESDWPNEAVSPKTQEKYLPSTANDLKNDGIISERNSTNDNDLQNSRRRGNDIIVPEISESDTRNESLSPRGGK